MAKQDQPQDTSTSKVGYDESQFEWETVHEEAPDQLIFEDKGDTYVGVYEGHEIIYPEADEPDKFFIQLKWRDPDGLKVTNAGYELRNTYTETKFNDDGKPVVTDRIPVGTMTRNVLVKTVDVNQASPMKSFRVDTAKPGGNAGNKTR